MNLLKNLQMDGGKGTTICREKKEKKVRMRERDSGQRQAVLVTSWW